MNALPRLLIYGAGGHAQVVADAVLAARVAGHGDVELVGFVDDDPEKAGTFILGLPVLGTLAQATSIAHDCAVVGVGHNRTRLHIAGLCRTQGIRLLRVVHPRATVAADAEIAEGSLLCAGVVVNSGSRIGANVILNTGCTVDHHNVIGEAAHIGPGAHLGGDVEIGEGALVGIGAIVMPQRRVGAWSIVGAGALVTRSLPAGITAMGAPARVVGKVGD